MWLDFTLPCRGRVGERSEPGWGPSFREIELAARPHPAAPALRSGGRPSPWQGRAKEIANAARPGFLQKGAGSAFLPTLRVAPEEIRGRAGRRGREGPTDLGTSRHQGDPAANRASARVNRARQRIANAALP